MNLFMILIGGKPDGRLTEQHDVFFGIANELKDLIPSMNSFWPEIEGKMHIDSWRKVTKVAHFRVEIIAREALLEPVKPEKLFFVNLGGYKENDMEEYHYKQLVVAEDVAGATRAAKEAIFYKHHHSSHIDDKYGVDVDDIYEIEDFLLPEFKQKYALRITENQESAEDPLHVGYLKLSKLLAK